MISFCCPPAKIALFAIQNAPSEDSDQPAHAQADLNLRLAHISDGTFTDVSAHSKDIIDYVPLKYQGEDGRASRAI